MEFCFFVSILIQQSGSITVRIFLINKFIIFAHQFFEFIQTTDASIIYVKYISNEINFFIHFIIRNYPRSNRFDSETICLIKKRVTKSVSIESSKYFFQWTTNTSIFRKIIKIFINASKNFKLFFIIIQFFDQKIVKQNKQPKFGNSNSFEIIFLNILIQLIYQNDYLKWWQNPLLRLLCKQY